MKNIKSLACVILCVTLIICTLCVSSTSAETLQKGTVNTKTSLNVRSGPGTNNSIVGSLNPGDVVYVIGTEKDKDGDGWYKINFGTQTAYVYSKYLDITPIYEYEADFEKNLEKQNFPESYKDLLRDLHTLHPNWIFLSDELNIEWSDALAGESVVGRNLVSGASPASYKSTDPGAYNSQTGEYVVFDSGGWVSASEAIIAYYLDPRNGLNSASIFQFLSHDYIPEVNTESSVQNMLKDTFMEGDFPESTYETYADVLIAAAECSNVNPCILASMILTEQGTNGIGNSISGNVEGYEGLYNYFNIGAYRDAERSAVQRGLWYAKGGDIENKSYLRPWDNRADSIKGGAMWYADGYVSIGQDTAYYKKFDMQGQLFTHQYETNIKGAFIEGTKLKDAYEDLQDEQIVFTIPIYKNMPEEIAPFPGNEGDNNYYLSSLSIGIDKAISFDKYTYSYEYVVENNVTELNVSATPEKSTSTVSGTGKISLNVGNNIITVTVVAQNGNTKRYNINVYRKEKSDEDETPIPKIEKSEYDVSEYIFGIQPQTTYEKFLSSFEISNGYLKIYNLSGDEVTSGYVGNGFTAKLYNLDDKAVSTHRLVIFGDASGNGVIDIVDIACIQMYLLGVNDIELDTHEHPLYFGYDANHSYSVNIVDIAAIQMHLLGISIIGQRR